MIIVIDHMQSKMIITLLVFYSESSNRINLFWEV